MSRFCNKKCCHRHDETLFRTLAFHTSPGLGVPDPGGIAEESGDFHVCSRLLRLSVKDRKTCNIENCYHELSDYQNMYRTRLRHQ